MTTNELFTEASILVRNLDTTPTDNEILRLYGLYKQATVGDCNEVNKPSLFDIKGKMKHEWWQKEKGKDKENAMKEYTEFVVDLMIKYNKS
tara:strand:- start:311 stop:583 length:273 start_codon:yes stop_codon:yes gene_type:complete